MVLMGINFISWRKHIYFQRVLAVIHQCQKLDMQEPKFESNISSKFDMQNLKLKVCVIVPEQNDTKSCAVIVMMALYQIYIQGKNIKNSIPIQISQSSNIYFSIHYFKQLR